MPSARTRTVPPASIDISHRGRHLCNRVRDPFGAIPGIDANGAARVLPVTVISTGTPACAGASGTTTPLTTPRCCAATGTIGSVSRPELSSHASASSILWRQDLYQMGGPCWHSGCTLRAHAMMRHTTIAIVAIAGMLTAEPAFADTILLNTVSRGSYIDTGIFGTGGAGNADGNYVTGHVDFELDAHECAASSSSTHKGSLLRWCPHASRRTRGSGKPRWRRRSRSWTSCLRFPHCGWVQEEWQPSPISAPAFRSADKSPDCRPRRIRERSSDRRGPRGSTRAACRDGGALTWISGPNRFIFGGTIGDVVRLRATAARLRASSLLLSQAGRWPNTGASRQAVQVRTPMKRAGREGRAQLHTLLGDRRRCGVFECCSRL